MNNNFDSIKNNSTIYKDISLVPSGIKEVKKSRLFKSGLIALLLLLLPVLLAFILKILQYWGIDKVNAVESIIHICVDNVEPFSILLGLIGIVLSLIIFIYVKKETDDRQKETDDRQREFNEQIKRIDIAVGEVLKSYTSLTQINGFDKRMEIIEEIYKMSEEPSNDLYIMTHSVTYGNLIAHKVETICEDSYTIDKEGVESLRDFYDKIQKKELRRIDNLVDSIEKRGRRRSPNKVKMMVLEKEKYITMISKVASSQVINLFGKFENTPFSYDAMKNNYLRRVTNNDDISRNAQEVFIRELSNYNEESYQRINSNNISKVIDIKRVTRLPFQFIASVPIGAVGKRKCLVVFTNMFSGSSVETVTCFSSENEQLIKNLIGIYESYITAYEDAEKEDKLFRSVFNLKDSKEIAFVMHETIISGSPESNLDSLVRFRDDVIAETKIKQFFYKRDKDYPINDDFLSDKDFETNEAFKKSMDKYNTVINIGLFQNKLTNLTIGEAHKNKRFFRIFKNENSNSKCIAVQSDEEGKIMENQWKQFISNYDDNDKSSYDIGIFAKVHFNGKTVIICGGCESYGTRKMGEYILNNWELMVQDKEIKIRELKAVYGNPQFVSVYKIPHEDCQEEFKIQLLHHYSK
jgi:hypothetical protein